jgi:hypothetical protein
MNIPPGDLEHQLIGLLDSSLLPNRMIVNMFRVSIFITQFSHHCASHSWEFLVREFISLEQEYSQWEADAAIISSYHRASSTDIPFTSSSKSEYDVYPGIWTASIWNKHRASRILLHQFFLQKSSNNEFDPSCMLTDKQRDNSSSTIQAMIKAIFASVPFSVGDIINLHLKKEPQSVGGYFLVWAHQVVLRCPFAFKEQREEARKNLLRIGRQFGISYATISARNTGEKVPLATKSSLT